MESSPARQNQKKPDSECWQVDALLTGGVSFCIPETRTAHPKVDRCALWRYSATPFLLDLNSVYSSARMAASSSSISLVTAARFSRSTPRRLFR